jgi:4-amino-4-deoxy-L-arabinose transferase-like glycosyltransferase
VLSTDYKTDFTTSKSWRKDFFALALLLGIFYALWLGSHALFTPDEGRYPEVAREMVVSGDYITPRLNGVAFLDKPALYYWLQASAIKLFGVEEWALRLWPAFLGVLGCLVSYGTGRLLFNRRTGLLAAAILATSPLYYGAAHYANLDLEVASLVADSLLCFIAAMCAAISPATKNRLLIAAYVFAGAATLTKGLIGIAFPGLIIGAWILLLNKFSLLTKMRLGTGLVIFALITVPWYVLVQRANPEFLHFFFVTQQVSRFLTTQDFNSKAPGWFYVPVVLAGFLPWTLFFFQALTQTLRRIWQDRQKHAVDLFLVLWFLIIFIFFSIPRSKTVGYILPVLPAMALITARYIDVIWVNPRQQKFSGVKSIFILLCLAVAGMFLAAPYLTVISFPATYFSELRSMALVLSGSALGALLLFRSPQFWKTIVCFGMTAVVSLLLFVSSVNVLNEKTVKPIALELKNYLQPGDEVVTYYRYYQDLPLYLQQQVTVVADWHAPDIAYNDNWLREMWYGMPFQNTSAWLIEKNTFWQRWNSDKRLFVVTDEDYYHELQKQTTVYKLSQFHSTVLLSNKPYSTASRNIHSLPKVNVTTGSVANTMSNASGYGIFITLRKK